MPSYSCKAVVIKHTKINDSDRIIKLLSAEYGVVDAIVKGARKITSKKGGNIDLINLVSVQISKGKSLDIVTEAEVINDYIDLKKDLFKIGLAYYLTEILSHFEYDNASGSKLFNRLVLTLDRIDKSKSKLTSVLVLKSFELGYLEMNGYKMPRPEIKEVQELFDILSTNNLENLLKIKYNAEMVKKLSDVIQDYSENVLEKKFKKVNLMV